MGIFTRLTDIVNSNINAILDKAEDPEKIIRMIIQEMEDTLVEVRSGAARAIADQKDIERKLKRVASAMDEWERKAELAISKGRDDLAKGALMERNKLGETVEYLQGELKHIAEALSRGEEDIVKLDSKLREARAKKASITARQTSAVNRVRVKRNVYDNRIADAFERFDKVENRLDRLEGEAEAMDLGRSENLTEAFSNLEGDEELDKELAALKAKVKGKPAVSSTPKAAPKKAAAKK